MLSCGFLPVILELGLVFVSTLVLVLLIIGAVVAEEALSRDSCVASSFLHHLSKIKIRNPAVYKTTQDWSIQL